MSTKDSAGDKLVASIRKTRGSTTRRSAPAKTVAKKPASRVKKKTAARKKTAGENRQRKEQLVDLFQSGGRVWPD